MSSKNIIPPAQLSSLLPGRGESVVLRDEEAVNREAANRFADLAHSYKPFTVALSGGSTPRKLYQMLAEPPFRDTIQWDQVVFFWGDERCVPPNHPDSNYRMARETLIDRIHVPPENVHRIRAELPASQAAAVYQAEIEAQLGAAPRFDLILLGLGTDGHTASLFPGTSVISERQRSVAPVYVQQLGTWRVTLTLPVLNAARNVLFLVTGRSKRPALARVALGEPLPATLVQPTQGNLTWLVDKEAMDQQQPPEGSRHPT